MGTIQQTSCEYVQITLSLLLPSALAGALLLLVADCLCRVLPLKGGELRLGIALSLIGAPFFLHLLLRMRKGLA